MEFDEVLASDRDDQKNCDMKSCQRFKQDYCYSTDSFIM